MMKGRLKIGTMSLKEVNQNMNLKELKEVLGQD